MVKTFLVKSISTDTVQYRLVQTGTLWHAERHVLTENGKWLLSWATDMWPNQYGARMAIKNAFDV